MKPSLMPPGTSVSKTPVSAAEQKRFTGRSIVMLDKGVKSSQVERQAKSVDVRIANISDYKSASSPQVAVSKALKEADGVMFGKLKVAVLNKAFGLEANTLVSAPKTKTTFLFKEPERFVYALQARRKNTIIEDDEVATWGLHAVNALNSHYTGKGVRIAVLDSGISVKHPDFEGRMIVGKSFTRSKDIEDHYGHGSHCAGIAAGNISRKKKFRYGVASDAELYVAKVLTNNGVGEDNNIIAAIEWALENKCKIISMSIGSEVLPGEYYSDAYETVAQRALENGALMVAAAGNDSVRKRKKVKPINHPANCPSIMAVAALDHELKIADFSCCAGKGRGSMINISAPGVDIFSTSVGSRYEILSGTSMATPFAAGMAAILWEQYPKASANEIWKKLIQTAKRIKLSRTDAGSGLVFYRRSE